MFRCQCFPNREWEIPIPTDLRLKNFLFRKQGCFTVQRADRIHLDYSCIIENEFEWYTIHDWPRFCYLPLWTISVFPFYPLGGFFNDRREVGAMTCYQDGDLVPQVLEKYLEFDRMTKATILATGLRCPDRCGKCCRNRKVWATVLECLPLAEYFYSIGDEEKILAETEDRIRDDDAGCILYRPDMANRDNGRCSTYPFRPLVCRLFGIAYRRNKSNEKELSLCKVIKERHSEFRAPRTPKEGKAIDTPVYQDCFITVASLHPGLGYRSFLINSAIKQAVEYLYWKYPRRFRKRKAAYSRWLSKRGSCSR